HFLTVDEDTSVVVRLCTRQDLDQAGLPRSVVAEDARHLAGIDVHRDAAQRHDVPVVLRDLVGLEQVAGCLGHRTFCARARISVFRITATKRIAPWNVNFQLLSHWASMMPSCTIPSIAAPKPVPITEPSPPV